MPERRKAVVIVGGGFGGLAAARALASEPVRVTLVDRRNHHLFLPLRYQVATCGLNPGDIAAPIRRILKRQDNATVLLGEAIGVDHTARRLRLAGGGAIQYDYLILAAGSRQFYLEGPGAMDPGLSAKARRSLERLGERHGECLDRKGSRGASPRVPCSRECTRRGTSSGISRADN